MNRCIYKILATFFFLSLLLIGNSMNAEEFRKVMEFRIWDFEDVPSGKLPPEWKVESGENGQSSCKVIEDASNENRILVLSDYGRDPSRAVCWTSELEFFNGSLEARMRPNGIAGAGLMWRIRDLANYYSVRYSSSDKRFVLYSVENGKLRELADAVYSTLDTSNWFILKVRQEDEKISCMLNGKELLTAVDSTHKQAGGVGVWTEPGADAAFDNVLIKLIFPEDYQVKQQI